MYDANSGSLIDHCIYQRADLQPADTLQGPAIIVEDETSTVVPTGYNVVVDAGGALILSSHSTEVNNTGERS